MSVTKNKNSRPSGSGLKIVFLDFTGTMDMPDPNEDFGMPDLSNVPVEVFEPRAKVIKPPKSIKVKIVKPKVVLKPSKKMDILDSFYSGIDAGGDGFFVGDDADYAEFTGSGGGRFVFKDEPNQTSKKFLRQLVEKTGAKIVYSSTRRISGWKDCAKYIGLPLKHTLRRPGFEVTPEIERKWFKRDWLKQSLQEPKPVKVSKSPSLGNAVESPATDLGWKERQNEIKAWLDKWTGAPIKNYVILDDDPIIDPVMAKHWVPSIRENGFMGQEYEHALRILKG